MYSLYTQDVNRPTIEALTAKHFEGFTILPASGYYHGQPEKTVVIQIADLNPDVYYQVRQLAHEIKDYNKQEAILVSDGQKEQLL